MARLNTLFRNIRINQGLDIYEMAKLCSMKPEDVYLLESSNLEFSEELLKIVCDSFFIDIDKFLNKNVDFSTAKYLYTDVFFNKLGHREIHDVYDVGLKKNAVLHRFGETKYSAIYVEEREFTSLERKWEPSLIVSWQGGLADLCIRDELNY